MCSERIRVVKFNESKYVLLYDECSTRFLRKIKYVTNIRYDTLCSKHSVSNIFPEPPPPYGVQLIKSCWIQNTSSLLKTSNTKNVWVKMWSDVNFVIINLCGLIKKSDLHLILWYSLSLFAYHDLNSNFRYKLNKSVSQHFRREHRVLMKVIKRKLNTSSHCFEQFSLFKGVNQPCHFFKVNVCCH